MCQSKIYSSERTHIYPISPHTNFQWFVARAPHFTTHHYLVHFRQSASPHHPNRCDPRSPREIPTTYRRPPVRTSSTRPNVVEIARSAISTTKKNLIRVFWIFFVSILPLTPSNNHTKRGYTRNTRCITNLTTPDTHTQHPTFHTRPTPLLKLK